MLLTVAELHSQKINDTILYDVNKVYIQLNEVSGKIVSSSKNMILLKEKNNFSIWSARDKRKMYDFTIDAKEIKALLSNNSENIIFFNKKENDNTILVGKLDIKSGIYQEKKIKNLTFTPLDIKSTFKFNNENNELSIFSNNKLWNLNIQDLDLIEIISFDKNIKSNYKDFLFISKNYFCFKIESDIKKKYRNTQLRPAEWQLDSIMLLDKKSNNLSKIKLQDNVLGAFSHTDNTILIDYENKITSLNIFSYKETNYPKGLSQKVYKTIVENENTLLFIGDKNLKKAEEIKSDSLYKAFQKSNEKSYDLYLYKKKESPYNLLKIDKIDKNLKYKKSKKMLTMNYYWNPSSNYYSSNFGVIYDKSNGIFSYYQDIETSQRWNIDYTRENLSIYEGLTLNNKGDFTFFGYDGLEVTNLTNEKELKLKENLKLVRLFFLENQNILSVYLKQENSKNLVQLELKNKKDAVIWTSNFIDSKIKDQINTNIYLNHTQTKGFIDFSPLYYNENNKNYTYNFDLNEQTVSKFNYKHGFFATENYSFASNLLNDSFNIYNNNSDEEQVIKDVLFLSTLENDNIIYKKNNVEGAFYKGKVTDNGIVLNFKYNLSNKNKFKKNASPFHFIKSKNLLTGVHDNKLLFWNLEQENSIKTLKLNFDIATHLVSSDKQLFVYYKNGFIDIVDLKSLGIENFKSSLKKAL